VGFFFAILFIFLLYGGTNYYIGKRIFQGLSFLFPSMDVKVYTVLYILIALSLILGFLSLPPSLKDILSWVGAYWMRIFVYLLMLFFVADLIVILGSIAKAIPSPLPQSIRFYEALIVLLLTAVIVSYGIYNASQIRQVSYDIKINETPLANGLKIALISDLHLGAINSEKNLEKIVTGINDLEPDIVCIAGDIFDDDFNALRSPERTSDLLKSIKSTYGVYACLGNHDGGKTFKEMVRFLESSNIKLLKDEYAVIDERLILIGRVDPSPIRGFGGLKRKEFTEILASIDPQDANLPMVVMDHTPANLEEYGKDVDLILSGHTHRGQLFPFGLVTNAIFTVDYGHYQKDKNSPHVIITSGAGTWGMPMRVGTNNEIVSIFLH